MLYFDVFKFGLYNISDQVVILEERRVFNLEFII